MLRRDAKTRRPLVFHPHSEIGHHGQRHLHVGSGVQLVLDYQLDRRLGIRADHRQAAQELAADRPGDDRTSAGKPAGLDPDRGRFVGLEPGAFDHRAQLPQGAAQIADRALAHPGVAVQAIVALSQAEQGGQKARRGAGVADEQIGLAGRDAPSQAGHCHF